MALLRSAVLSRKVRKAIPVNIAHCPDGIFVTDREGRMTVGYRTLPEGSLQALLDEIARDAPGGGGDITKANVLCRVVV
jgi:hypothetical protein